jgi:hypothetical protein
MHEANLTAPISLPNRESRRALEILEDELLTLRPTRWQRVAYQLLHLDVAVFVIALAIAIVVAFATDRRQSSVFTATGFAGLLATLALLVLIPMNVPLMLRVWRAARIRRQLGLDEPLAAAFRAQRRRKRIRNVLSALLVVLGAYLVGYVIVITAPTFGAADQLSGVESVVRLIVVFLYLVVGVTLLGLHFVRRAMDRFAVVVERVHGSVTTAVEHSKERGASDVPVEPEDYELIAHVEREQIMRDRLESVHEREHRRDAGYAVHIGLDAQQAKEALSPDDRVRVDEEIFRLADDIGRGRTPVSPSLTVPGTRIALRFDVDHEARRIRIVEIGELDLESGQDTAASLPG